MTTTTSTTRPRTMLTTQGAAQRLVNLHATEITYVPAQGWFWWDGEHWVPDRDGEYLAGCYRRTLKTIRDAAHRLFVTRLDTIREAALTHLSFAFYAENAPCAKQEILEAASRIPEIRRTSSEFNADNRSAR